MIPYAGGVLVAFANAGGNGNRIWFSPDGKKLGGGELRYDGSSHVIAMISYKRADKEGVLTAFRNAGQYGYRIHWSPDGLNLGGGNAAPYYDGSTPVTALLAYNGGVFTAFLGRGDPDPKACPLEPICAGIVLICRTGKQRGAQCAPDKSEACGVCVGISTP